MSYDTEELLKDKNKLPIPQGWDNEAGTYKPVEIVKGAHKSLILSNAISVAPVTAQKTIGTTAAELFAGSSRLSGRYVMSVYNEGSNIVYWGQAGVTTATGYPLMPGDSIKFSFYPAADTPINFVAAASNNVRVVELA